MLKARAVFILVRTSIMHEFVSFFVLLFGVGSSSFLCSEYVKKTQKQNIESVSVLAHDGFAIIRVKKLTTLRKSVVLQLAIRRQTCRPNISKVLQP